MKNNFFKHGMILDLQDIDSIYREYAKTVYRFLYAKTQNAHAAEELTQETFYQAIRSIDRYHGECSILTWLCSIATHIWQQRLEKNSKLPLEELSQNLSDPSQSIEEQLIHDEQKINLLKALHCLKEPAREILYLRLFGDLSYREIGEIFSQSETWARVTFFRGKQALLKGDFYEKLGL